MLSQNVIIAIITVIIGIIMFGVVKEDYCNCTGMAARTAYPTYYTYRPFGDVSNYGNDYLNSDQYIKIGAELPPMTRSLYNLGWKTGMPYDSFVASMAGNSWAAGSDPEYRTHSSVPMLALGYDDKKYVGPNAIKSNNGGYATNYGDSFNDELLAYGSGPKALLSGQQFVSGQYGYPNMLSNGQPELVGPAGSFSESAMPCGASANAYNLAVGVL